jgi:hypothetical protein
MKLRSRLSYANVVATVALFLVLSGGTVYAAVQLGKDDVRSKHIAPGAVQSSELDEDAVTSPKIRDGSVKPDDLSGAIFDGVGVDVAGSASAGAQGGVNTATDTPLPLNGKTSFSVAPGEVGALAAEARWTIASTSAAEFCNPSVVLAVNGERTRVFVDPTIEGNNTTLESSFGRDADGPFGVINPGEPLKVTAFLHGDADCTADSQLDRFVVRLVKIH